jgi:hypothetical protein
MWPAVGCALVATLAYCRNPQEWERSENTPYRVLLAAYFGIAVVSGGIWGMLRPFAKTTVAQAGVASVAAWPPAFVFVLAMKDTSALPITLSDFLLASGLALFAGPLTLGMYGLFEHLKLTGRDAQRGVEADGVPKQFG